MATDTKKRASKKPKKKIDWVLGIDLGNGMVKVRAFNKKTGKPYILTIPSAWAFLKDIGENVTKNVLELDTYWIEDKETAYVWGEDIAKVSSGSLKSTYGLDNRYQTDAFKIMVKIVLARLASDLGIVATDKVLVVTGVPSEETGTVSEEHIAEAFAGVHTLDIKRFGSDEDVPVVIKVDKVEVMPQATSAVIGRYLDEDGYVADEDYEVMTVGVIDIGAGTTDLDVIKDLRRLAGFKSIKKGYRIVYNSIRKEIKRTHPSHVVSDYILLDALETCKYTPSKRGKEIDITQARNEGIDELVIEIQQAVTSEWSDHVNMDEVLLIGASAEGFEERLENVITGLTIPENPELSNVEGYYRWGMFLTLEDDDE